ncbi:hypothetical protein AB4Y36_38000 [Paraburkholderia sp. BR10936]|uniref:phage protein n=1 Tax=Paraburkholderia sp. BR10936 TaxID=3236993 RepID=UPI0034D2E536
MQQFGRRYQLIIGSRSEGFAFNNLRVAFEVTKTLEKTPNPAKIRIWNLTRQHMGAVLSKLYTTVALSVGYEALRVIYAGDIVKSNVERDGMDFVLELECGDGNTAYTSARANMTLPAGTTDAQAARALVGTMPDTTRGAMGVTRTEGSARARVYCGNTRDCLSNLARANEADWSIQDGAIVMLPANAAIAGAGPLISQDTGMVGMPRQTDNGLEVNCLCNPAILVGGVVRVQSILPHYSGDYKVVSVHHSGDFAEGDWLSQLVVIGGQFQKVAKETPPKGPAAGSDGSGDDGGYEVGSQNLAALATGQKRVWSVAELAP